MRTRQEDWEAQRLWREDRERRLAVRMEEQRLLHEADPFNVPLYLPVDDEEFPDESYTAGWSDDEEARYTYDDVTDLFYLDGHPVQPPGFSPESGDAWEDWRIAHDLDELVWESCSLPDNGPGLWRRYHYREVGYVTWDGTSDDAADSQVDDLDDASPDDIEPCAECGREGSAGGDHSGHEVSVHREADRLRPVAQPLRHSATGAQGTEHPQ